MKILQKLIIGVVIAVLVVIIALYFGLQTRWGAGQIASWVSDKSGWHITFDRMRHHWSAPSRVVLENVRVGQANHPDTLVAQQVDFDLSTRQLTDPLHVDTLVLSQGALNLSPQASAIGIRADTLQLRDMALNSPGSAWELSAQKVNGGLRPWQPVSGNVLGTQAQFQLSAGSLTINGLPATNVLIDGGLNKDEVTLTNIGGDIARGTLTADARRQPDGHWQVNNLRMNNTRYQTDKPLLDFLAPLATLPAITFHRVDMTDAQLQGPDWALSGLNLSLNNLTLANGGWSSKDGGLSMNANEAIYGQIQLLDPIINASLNPQGMAIKQFTTRWQKGMVRASGHWWRNGQKLALDELVSAGLEYTLPEDWKAIWQSPLPAWLQEITVAHFSATRNLLIDTDPAFPFQLTGLDASGNNLVLVREGYWGIWGGDLALNAIASTFNRTDVRMPALTLNANLSTINISQIAGAVGKGKLAGTATIAQLPQRQTSLSLTGQAIPLDSLANWGWPAIPLQGDGNIQLVAQGNLQTGVPLAGTVNGTLTASDATGQQATQRMVNGQLAPGQ